MALDVEAARARDRQRGRRAARPRSSKRRRAASWRSSTTTWWARCASSRSSAATIRATSRWCRSAARARCMAARSPRLLGITRVLVPPAPGVLCADGLLAADLKAEFSRTLPKAGHGRHRRWRGRSSPSCRSRPTTGSPTRRSRRPTASRCAIAMMRYHGQGGEVASAGSTKRPASRRPSPRPTSALYGFTLDCADRAGDAARRGDRPHAGAAAVRCCRQGHRRQAARPFTVHFASGTTQVPLFDRAALRRRRSFAGPAIISQLDATTLVLPGWTGEVHPSGAIVLTASSQAPQR